MKALHTAYYIIFSFSALITVNLLVNSLRCMQSTEKWLCLTIFLVVAAVQTAGLSAFAKNHNRVVKGVLTLLTGLATYISGSFAYISCFGAYDFILKDVSTVSMFVSYFLFACYIFMGIWLLVITDKSKKISSAEQ